MAMAMVSGPSFLLYNSSPLVLADGWLGWSRDGLMHGVLNVNCKYLRLAISHSELLGCKVDLKLFCACCDSDLLAIFAFDASSR